MSELADTELIEVINEALRRQPSVMGGSAAYVIEGLRAHRDMVLRTLGGSWNGNRDGRAEWWFDVKTGSLDRVAVWCLQHSDQWPSDEACCFSAQDGRPCIAGVK